MNIKKVLQGILIFVLDVVLFFLILILLGIYIPSKLHYSKALQMIEEKPSSITEVVMKGTVASITVDGTKYTTVVPNAQEFVDTIMVVAKGNEKLDIYFREELKGYEFFICVIIFIFIDTILGIVSKSLKKATTVDEEDSNSIITNFKKAFGVSDFSEDIKKHVVKDVKVTFNDVAGLETAKEILKDIAKGILDAERYEEYGAKLPSGILLEGASGTGKTLIAKALAGEVNVPFIQYSATEMINKWVGDSEENVRELFDYAKKNAPCIIFFDEIDSIATSRQKDIPSYMKTLLNQLLVSLDGFTPRDGVIFIAATNFIESLDTAFKRPGRFDKIVHIDLPNVEEREAILMVHARNKKLSSDINLKELARNTTGLSGAELANILNEATLLQLKSNHAFTTALDVNEAHRIVRFGAKSNKKMDAHDKYLTAIHELGHAFTSQDSIKEIAIIPRGEMGGYTWHDSPEYEYYLTAKKIEKDLVCFLGGTVAERIILKDSSTGAQNDMERAWQIAYDYVSKYGMSEKIGPICIKSMEAISDSTKEEILKETKKMIDSAFKEATKIIEDKKELIIEIAELLISKEILYGDEFYEIISKKSI